ncbi:MAG: (Fe-S)-binding protein, partial [Myxococcales bacterium]
MEPLQLIAAILSLGVTAIALVMTGRAVASMLGVIRVGQKANGRTDQPVKRGLTMLKETFLHTRMLQWTWVGILHWFAFAAFLILSSAVAQAFVQLFKADFAWPIIGHWIVFEWVSEFIGLLGSLAIIPLIIYRLTHTPNKLGRQSRFFGSTMWQAYFVEAMVLLESSAILFIRGAEYKFLDHAEAAHFPVSQFFSNLYPDDKGSLENIIYVIAAIKIISAMVWLIVISSNLTMGVAWHRFTAWFNIFFKRESDGSTALGAMKPMTSGGEVVNFEDLEDMDEDTKLGVGAIEDFSWKGILDFTTCTECGRCQSQCPAWNTEKPLSPKLMMMGLREHAYAKAPYLNAGGEGSEAAAALLEKDPAVADAVGRQLVGNRTDDDQWFYNPEGGDFVIDADALWSCTSCGACVQQCPVDIEHVDHFMDMRRYQILVESNFPAELNGLFKGLENKGNPWNMNPKGRMEWAQGLEFDVPVLGETAESMDDFEWLFWVGCAGAYEDRAKKTTRAVAELLDMAGVKFAVLGNGETCTGDPARRAGNEFVFQGLATQNAETFKEMKVKKVVSTCAHCFNTLKNEYQEFGVELEVVH